MVSIRYRVTGIILVDVCWLAFIILFLAFYPAKFDFWQNVAAFLASGIIVAGIIALIWIKMIPV